MLFERGHDAHADVGHGTDVEHRSPLLELLNEVRILDGTNAVAQPVGVQEIERVPDRVRRAQLSRVRDRAQASFAGAAEDVLVEMRWKLELERAETDTDDASLAVADGVTEAVVHLLGGRVSRQVRGEPHLEAVRLARLVDSVAEALVDRLPAHAAAHELQRREDAFDIDGAVLERPRPRSRR